MLESAQRYETKFILNGSFAMVNAAIRNATFGSFASSNPLHYLQLNRLGLAVEPGDPEGPHLAGTNRLRLLRSC